MSRRMNPAHRPFPAASSWIRYKHGAQSFPHGSASASQVYPESLIERYKQGELHAVSLIHNLASIFDFKLEMKETVTPDYVQGLYFAFCVVINDVTYKTGIGSTKKDARRQAAQFALQELLPRLQSVKEGASPASGVASPLPVQQQPFKSRPPEAQAFRACREKKPLVNLQIPHAVRDQLTKLMNSHPEFSDLAGSTAAFIIETSSRCEVIAIGSGNVNARESQSTDGRLLHDSHAVVTARRSLMRFLYRHLLMFFRKEAVLRQKSVFEQNSSSSSLLSLKRDLTLHLYINQLPKGAAHSLLHLKPLSICAWEATQEVGLHLAVQGKVFPVSSIAIDHSNSNLVSMSAADKLAQWQVLGYQGALLSHFIEPVYVHSIFIGDPNCSDTRGLEFSVSQRVEGITAKLPMYYCMIRPRIILVPNAPTSSALGSRHPNYSINWIQDDVSLEVVDGREGRTVEESPFRSSSALASRLCKAAMLHRFKLVAKHSEREELLAAGSYRKLKKIATPYQEAKSILRAHLMSRGFGSWQGKVSVCENFSM